MGIDKTGNNYSIKKLYFRFIVIFQGINSNYFTIFIYNNYTIFYW